MPQPEACLSTRAWYVIFFAMIRLLFSCEQTLLSPVTFHMPERIKCVFKGHKWEKRLSSMVGRFFDEQKTFLLPWNVDTDMRVIVHVNDYVEYTCQKLLVSS